MGDECCEICGQAVSSDDLDFDDEYSVKVCKWCQPIRNTDPAFTFNEVLAKQSGESDE